MNAVTENVAGALWILGWVILYVAVFVGSVVLVVALWYAMAYTWEMAKLRAHMDFMKQLSPLSKRNSNETKIG